MAFIIAAALIVFCFVASYLNQRRNMKLLSTVSSPDRGTMSECKLVIKMLKRGVHPKAIFHDLYVQKKNGEYTQIDLVVATPQGLVVIEVKNYSGWLFGHERQKYWTQLLNFGKAKYRFYNPLMQNQGHIQALKEQSEQFAHLPYFNIVLFTGTCTLKDITCLSANTYVGYVEALPSILQIVSELPPADYTDKREVATVLRRAVANGTNPTIVASHFASVHRNSVGQPQPIINQDTRMFRINWRRLMRY